MDIDEAFRQAGEYGPLQRRVFWSMAIPQAFVAWHHLHNVFVAAEPQFKCIRGQGETQGCPKNDEPACERYEYGTEFTSVASEWDLVCSNSYKSDLIQSIYMAGLLFGNLIGGYIADQYGRRRLAYISILLNTAFSLIAADVTSYNSYVFWRFLAGVCTGAYGLVSFTLPTELVGAKQRGFVNVVMTVVFALGVGSFSLLAYFIRDWRYLSVVTALPGLIGIYYYKLAPESPRWLLTQGRLEEAEQVLTSIAIFNGNHPPSSPVIRLRPLSVHPIRTKQASLLDIIRNPTLRYITINNLYTWFVNSMVYYGLTMRAGNLNGNRYINVALAGLIEIPADIVTLYLMDKYGRRVTYSWSMLFGGIFCVGIIITPGDSSMLQTVLALLGKMGISMSFCVAWMHAAEMYPTSIRNKALSVCNTSSRLGGVVSPLVLTLGRNHPNMDFTVFGFMAFLGGVISGKLPETLNRPMPETVEDVDSWISMPTKTRIIDLSKPGIMDREVKNLEAIKQHEEEFEVLERLRD